MTARPPAHGGGPDARGGNGAGGGNGAAKAVVLAVVGVVLGVLLLQAGQGHPSGSATSPPTSSTTTTVPVKGTTTTTTAAAPSQAVKVLVANASNTDGVAAYYTSKLSGAGWGTLTPTTATTEVTTSAVYYASGQQAAATAIAKTLGLDASVVQALGTQTPVQDTTGADVVVVVGNDLAAQMAPSTTPG